MPAVATEPPPDQQNPVDDVPPPEPLAPERRGLIYLFLAGSIVVFATCLLIYLLWLGEPGNVIAGPSSLYVAILGIVCTLVIWLFEREHIVIHLSPMFRLGLRSCTFLALVSLLVGAIFIFERAFSLSDIPITEEVRASLQGERGMSNASEAVINIPTSTARKYVSIIPDLRNNSPTGNCAHGAKLNAYLRTDGTLRHSSLNLQRGQEFRFSLTGVVQAASVGIRIEMRDLECRVDLRIEKAILTNNGKES